MKINNNLDKLRDEMLKAHLLAGYSSHTIKKFKEAFKRIGRDVQSGNCATYEDVFWKHYGDKSKAVERGGRWVIGAIEYFDISGQLPGGVRRSKTWNQSLNYQRMLLWWSQLLHRPSVERNHRIQPDHRQIGYRCPYRCRRKTVQKRFLPEIPCVRKNLTKRDRAIGLLAMYIGLRSCDIAGLLLEDIDWIQDTISITQQKTGKPLTLPLSATAGNTLYDYIHDERPAVSIHEVFVTVRSPFRRIVSGDCCNIATVIMKQAGIRKNKGDRRGLHLFLHHLVTGMPAHEVPATIISEVPGHASPNSIQAYLSADFTHLKACSLSIEQFPLREGVLR